MYWIRLLRYICMYCIYIGTYLPPQTSVSVVGFLSVDTFGYYSIEVQYVPPRRLSVFDLLCTICSGHYIA